MIIIGVLITATLTRNIMCASIPYRSADKGFGSPGAFVLTPT